MVIRHQNRLFLDALGSTLVFGDGSLSTMKEFDETFGRAVSMVRFDTGRVLRVVYECEGGFEGD